MPVRKVEIEQTATMTWSGDTTLETDVERQGLITQIDVTANITPSATLTGANQPDSLARVLSGVRLLGGTRTYFTTPSVDGGQSGVLLHYMNKEDGHGIGHPDGAIAAPSQTFTSMNWVLHPGSRVKDMYGRYNPFDLSAFIPAGLEDQLKAEVDTDGNDVLDDTVTLSSAVIRFTLHRIFGNQQEIQAEMNAQGCRYPAGASGMVPTWSAIAYALTGTTNDFDSDQLDVVTGAYLKRINMLAQDATANRPLRAGDEVIATALIFPETTERVFQGRHDHLVGHMEYGTMLEADDAAADFQAHAAKGIYLRDLRKYHTTNNPTGYDYGLNLTQMKSGTVKLGLRIGAQASGDDLLVIYERYAPYFGAVV